MTLPWGKRMSLTFGKVLYAIPLTVTLPVLLLCTVLCDAQVPYRETVPDIRFHVSGQKGLSSLSNDDALFTILAFENEDGQGNDIPIWYTDDSIKPFFQNYNPDYGRTLFIVSSMRNRKRIERKLGVSSYPEYVLVGADRRILTRSHNAEDIIDYVTANLSMFAETDWEEYVLKARDLFESGQSFAARRIISDFLRHARWKSDFSPEVHNAVPRIVATMKDDEMYMFFVAEIKHKYNLGILSDKDVAPFKEEFSTIHMMGDEAPASP